ncbi:MAG: hypothetical protein R3E96_11645 [Planctomycetota bacterium]
MHLWLASKIAEDYAMTADHDTAGASAARSWRSVKDARLDAVSLEEGIRKFASERNVRLAGLQV